MKYVWGCILLACLVSSCGHRNQNFSAAVTHFEKSTKGASAMYFYPAIIKMLNFSKDSALSAMTRYVKKAKVVRLSEDSINNSLATNLIDQVKKEKFVYLMEIKKGDYQIVLFMKKWQNIPKHYIAIAYSPKNLTVVDLLGTVPLKFLPDLLNRNINFNGFETVLNAAQESKHNQKKPANGNDTRNK